MKKLLPILNLQFIWKKKFDNQSRELEYWVVVE